MWAGFAELSHGCEKAVSYQQSLPISLILICFKGSPQAECSAQIRRHERKRCHRGEILVVARLWSRVCNMYSPESFAAGKLLRSHKPTVPGTASEFAIPPRRGSGLGSRCCSLVRVLRKCL